MTALQAHFEDAVEPQRIQIVRDPGATGMSVRGVSVVIRGKTALHDINFNIEPGQRIFLKGPSGCGKSTLLKACTGIHLEGTGTITRPDDDDFLLSVPQDVYFPVKTLRGILCYPDDESNFSNEQFAEALTLVGMERMIPELDNPGHLGPHWENELSGGEQQRIIFARILLLKRPLLLADEITSALDEESENYLYNLLIERNPDMAIVSISHHAQLLAAHTHLARIENGTLLPLQPVTEDLLMKPEDNKDIQTINAKASADDGSPSANDDCAPTSAPPQAGPILRLLRALA